MPGPPATDPSQAVLVRRLLLGLITALLVARPLVLGEDPGLLDPLSGSTGLVLSVLWLTAGVGWAAWWAWSRCQAWQGSIVEVGLFGVVALAFLSTVAAASYKHPAWLITWEWLILLLAFCLVRQLSLHPRENQALLAAVVASAVSLAGHAVYQYAVELPQLRAQLNPGDLGSFQRALANQGILFEEGDPQLAHWAQRILANNVFATFAHPNSLAGYLVLILPVAAGWSLTGRRQLGWSGQIGLAFGLTLLLGLALWLTHSRGAILALVLVGLALALGYGYAFLWKHKVWVLATLLGVGGTLIAFLRSDWSSASLGKNPQTMSYRLDYWTATWHMILDHPLLGVGPGNFGRFYPRYMSDTAIEKVSDPHNWLLEIWASCGIFALLAFLGAIGGFFGLLLRGIGSLWKAKDPAHLAQMKPADQILPWEFYLGGTAGMILGFLLRAAGSGPDEVVTEGFLACVRAVLWFVAFAVLNAIPWSGPSRILALVAGVAALLFNCSVSGGITSPSVAQPLWVQSALALSALPLSLSMSPELKAKTWSGRWVWEPRSWLQWVLPVPMLVGLWLAYVILFFSPVSTCADSLNLARRYYGPFFQLRQQVEEQAAQGAVSPQRDPLLRTTAYLRAYVLKPLEQAQRADPNDILPLLELATWHGEQAKLLPQTEEFWRQALGYATFVQKLDPESKDGYWVEYRLYLHRAQLLKTQAKQAYGLAARALEAVVQRDPTEARWHYLLAESLFRADIPIQGRSQAELARQMDERARDPARQLTPAQREQIRLWLLAPPS
jgi:hypothetical protein